jgi:hypothetical protein
MWGSPHFLCSDWRWKHPLFAGVFGGRPCNAMILCLFLLPAKARAFLRRRCRFIAPKGAFLE